MGYKAGFKFAGQSEVSFNAHIFATEIEATTAGEELMSRWFLPIGFDVIEIDAEPTAVIKDGRPWGIEHLASLEKENNNG